MEIMNTTENAPSAKKLQMIINSGISKNSIKELLLKDYRFVREMMCKI